MGLRRRTRPAPQSALVCFTGRSEIVWLRWLKPGFRHCFCLLPTGGGWLLLDPRCNRLEVRPLPGTDRAGLIRHFTRAGYRVVAAEIAPDQGAGRSGPCLYTCVEAVKRALGLHAPLVVTPYALYRHLKKISPARKNLLTLCSLPSTQELERARSVPRGRSDRVARPTASPGKPR